MAYATIAQFQATGLPAKALIGVPTSNLQAALDNASGEMDDRAFNARFVLPLFSWGTGVVQKCIDIAAWIALRDRGFDPNQPLDIAIRTGYTDALKWLDDVANQRAQPVVIDSSQNGNTAAAPVVMSSPPRGWEAPPIVD